MSALIKSLAFVNRYDVRLPIRGFEYVNGSVGLCFGVGQLFDALRAGWRLP